jgi:4-hydroxybenzoate polyprenyltransferase
LIKVIKNIFSQAADTLIFGNFFIALCAASLVVETYILLGHPPMIDGLTFFVFFSTLALYNFHRLNGIRRIKPEDQGLITGWAAKHRFSLLMLVIIGIGGASFFVFQLFNRPRILFLLVPLGIVSIFYELPLVKYRREFERIRNLWLSKAFLITTVWAISTALLPAMDIHFSLRNHNVWMVVIERLIFIFILALCFDARDVEFDRSDRVKTIPIVYGTKKTMELYKVLSLLFLAVTFFHYVIMVHQWKTEIAMVVSCALTYLVVSKTNPRRSDYYYMFVVDGMMLVQFLLTWLLSRIR